MPLLTEKQSPWAWLGPWYGSYPIMTTLRESKGVRSKAENNWLYGGKVVVGCSV